MTDRNCPTGKLRFPNRKAAYRALLAAWRDHSHGHTDRRERNAYDCSKCDGWHLTSWTEEEYRAKKAGAR